MARLYSQLLSVDGVAKTHQQLRCCVCLAASTYVSTPHCSTIARLAAGAFCLANTLDAFCESIFCSADRGVFFMQYETRARSIFKALSWRTWATITTAVIVFAFTGRFALALTVGALEVVAKMALYFFHERLWQKIRWGKKEVPAFVLWFTGLPASGKKAVADRVYQLLKDRGLKVERLDSRDVRPLFPETGFSPPEVNRHVKRSGHLCAMLEKNGVSVVASFVSPYRESREFARRMAATFVEVHMRSTPEACMKRDSKGHYARAQRGEFKYFPGVDVAYEQPRQPEIVIDVEQTPAERAAEQVLDYLKKHVLVEGRRLKKSLPAAEVSFDEP
ncbi:adenylyl-sulfate kinase [Geothermobacter hydrogeniphilus]|uniref:Adenylyl-sulfate kinase n=2 Tax=Geothermobacter hydrogeniphilus TaxID=1969733 RepID=A0A2K2H9Z8_9BACT|nr:adenylyl-sulfate kinase [Geothermobacter hydrogeniphilus]